jgi:GTPase-associated protein 1, N-terminal domain type 1
MADPTTDHVDRVVHGYGHGHELLQGSTTFDDETANLLGHNSDSASNARPSDGPYLTGYPLVDGRYVIAKTWHDTAAERPNTVVSLSLILPGSTPAGFSMERVLAHLGRMPQRTLDYRLEPIPMSELIGEPLRLTVEESFAAVPFYASPRPLTFPTSSGRERIAVAIWKQLWRSARYGLSFCTAPDTDRFARAPISRRFNGDETVESQSPNDDLLREIAADLQDPGQFREFVHFVGSGERAVGLMRPFALAFALLSEPHAGVRAFENLLSDYKGTDPRRLRRLKRRVLGFQRGDQNWHVDPFDLLQALGSGPLGDAVYASDASLDRWVLVCWDIDPLRTAGSLSEATGNEDQVPAGPPTAREGIASAFATQVPLLVTPTTLAIAAALNPAAALGAIWTQNDPALWRAWSELDPPLDVPGGDQSDEFDWRIPLTAVRASRTGLVRILRRYPEALDHLIALADAEPAPSDLDLDLTWDAKRYLRNRLETSDLHLAGSARLADPGTLPRALNTKAWTPVLRNSKDEVVNAIAYRIGREAGRDAWETATLATGNLYAQLSGEGASAAWKRLGSNLRGDRNSRDRCARLVEDFAHVLRGYPEDTKSKSVTLLRERSPAAAQALERRLRSESEKAKRKKFTFYDPTTW